MVWLPTLHDCRKLFAVLDMPISEFGERLGAEMEAGQELDLLYAMIEQRLQQNAGSPPLISPHSTG
jgi:hypothetical protein